MTTAEMERFGVLMAELIDAKLAPLKDEIRLTRQAAERASEHGIEANTRFDQLLKRQERAERRLSRIEDKLNLPPYEDLSPTQ